MNEAGPRTSSDLSWAASHDIAEFGARNRAAYAAAEPFPHAIFDGFFDAALLSRVAAEFPDLERDSRSMGYDDPNQVKFASRGDQQFPELTRQLMAYVNSVEFTDFLTQLTGIEKLVSDPTFLGGGLHQIGPGGFLKIHADFNQHRVTGLDRRLNALIYLNQDWQEEYGGHLELWSRDMQRCVRHVLPVFNRMVVFTTDESSFHGHPDPLCCPRGRWRRSLALYYYTEGRPVAELTEAHSTLFRDRPDSDDATRRHQSRLRMRLRRTLRRVGTLVKGPKG